VVGYNTTGMAEPTPGENEVPYTHREVFLTADNAVGQGLDTYGRLGNTELQSKESFQEVISDKNTLNLIRSTEKLWNELLKSIAVRKYAESEFTVEYAAKNASSIPEQTYRNVSSLLNANNLKDVNKEDIKVLLGIDMIHLGIWNDRPLFNELLRTRKNWMDFFPNLSTFGDPLPRMNPETKKQLCLYAIGKHGSSPYTVFNQQSNIDALLTQTNDLSKTRYTDIPTNHPSWISGRSNSYNINWVASSWSTENWRSSEYTNRTALHVLKNSYEMRELIAQSRLGINDPDFSFHDLFNGNVVNNFWNENGSIKPLKQLDAEFIESAKAESDEGSFYSYDSYNYVYADGEISGGSNLTISGDAEGQRSNSNNDLASAIAEASLTTEPIDVSNKGGISIDLNHITGGNDIHHNHGTPYAKIKISDSKETTYNVGQSSNRVISWNISDENTIQLSLSASGAHDGDYDSTKGSMDINDITFND